MPELKSEAKFKPGARFYRDHESKVQFEHVVDGKNKIGPYEATQAEIDAHPKAYEQFEHEDSESRKKHKTPAILTDGSSAEPDGDDPKAMMVPEEGDARQWIADPNQHIDPQSVAPESDSGAGITAAPGKRSPGRPRKNP